MKPCDWGNTNENTAVAKYKNFTTEDIGMYGLLSILNGHGLVEALVQLPKN